jgi:hypothetical protein
VETTATMEATTVASAAATEPGGRGRGAENQRQQHRSDLTNSPHH